MCADDNTLYSVPSMEKVPEKYDDRITEMSEMHHKIAAEQLREDDSIRSQSLAQMREFIAKHPHIKKCRTDAQFLLRFLRSKKYSINSATEVLERFLIARKVHPQWFYPLDIEDPELNAFADTGYLFPLPERDAKGRAMIFNETGKLDPTKFAAHHVTRMHMMVYESLMDQSDTQCAGVVHVYDLTGMTMAQISLVTLNEIKALAGYLNKATPMRIQEFHFVNTPGATATIVNFAMQLLSDKLRERVFCHNNWDELYAVLDKNLLPKEFGGKIPKAELIEQFKQRCQKLRGRLLTMSEFDIEITKDSKYWQETTDAELETGAVGSFRKLTVD
ncbi:retinaldehyde-binding protein 1-like [Toxorhynchites rutilus septentrionalis]|uniref:retinaldehyde-binding protein 1-like n=1 Tax=Toxorhynchites rutilus septentrionalis TaxID=329112 RepID=UPI00247A13C5|nr:retinaldehyde-binding protein 1-like [Toxorhynchites rutilus septentrionalis]